MKYYLSSYKLGNETKKLKELTHENKKIGYIPNALDFTTDLKRREKDNQDDIKQLTALGLKVEEVDLRNYFNKKNELQKKIKQLGAIWVRGGNTFVLRQAMKLSGLDEILKNMKHTNFIYTGYSAAGCVLSPSLKYLQIVDDPTLTPYEVKKVIWDGLGLIDFAFLPHYKSNHPESKDIDKEVEYCKKHNIPFKTLKDGEVIVIE